MEIKQVQTFKEAWKFFIANPPIGNMFVFILWWHLYILSWSLMLYLGFKKNKEMFVGLYDKNRLVGMAIYSKPYFYYCGVAKDYRRKGLCFTLYSYSECDRFWLMNKNLKKHVERLGYKRQRLDHYIRGGFDD